MSIINIKLKKFKGKKIAFLGLGAENFSLLKFFLKNKLEAEFIICDQRTNEEIKTKLNELNRVNFYKLPIRLRLERKFKQDLHEFDILLRSPGWPVNCPSIKDAKRKNKLIVVTSPMNIFFELSPTKNTVGVTGTKGKGTTASLIEHILKTGRKKVWLGGNIGIAPFDYMEKIGKADWVVLELSSFQLEDLVHSPHISVITNFSSEHLRPADPNNPNYHASLRKYWQAKRNIFSYQSSKDFLVGNIKIKKRIEKESLQSKTLFFTKSHLKSSLPGEHNKENIEAAVKVAELARVGAKTIAKAIKSFKGLEHRLEFVREVRGVKYYNDSFSTIPESAITAILSFDEPIVLLAGGADKGSDFKQLAKSAVRKVIYIVLFEGKATPRLKKELLAAGFEENRMVKIKNMAEAVARAKAIAKAGDIVIMSPACASFGMFKNYKDRGQQFKSLVMSLE